MIAVNPREPSVRQRFTLFHEYKHVIDHGQTDRLYPGYRLRTGQQQAEAVADYFAGCVLMPRALLKRLWGEGMQDPLDLAERFEVSVRAVEVRLAQVGLVDEPGRCASTSREQSMTRRAA